MIGDYPTQLDEIDQWISDTFGILPGACSSIENLRYSVARRVAEALWPNNQSLSDANKRLEEISRKGLENAHTVDFSKQYENSMKILQKAKINLSSDVDEAAEKAYPSSTWREGKIAEHMTNLHCQKAFKAGAEWQKKQMGEQARKELFRDDLTLADLVAFDVGCNLGRRLERQDMLRDATERTVKIDSGGYPYIDIIAELYDYEHNVPLAKEGELVKIIIVKEENK